MVTTILTRGGACHSSRFTKHITSKDTAAEAQNVVGNPPSVGTNPRKRDHPTPAAAMPDRLPNIAPATATEIGKVSGLGVRPYTNSFQPHTATKPTAPAAPLDTTIGSQ